MSLRGFVRKLELEAWFWVLDLVVALGGFGGRLYFVVLDCASRAFWRL